MRPDGAHISNFARRAYARRYDAETPNREAKADSHDTACTLPRLAADTATDHVTLLVFGILRVPLWLLDLALFIFHIFLCCKGRATNASTGHAK